MKRLFTVIKCPNCGTEYLPAEIYVPNAFFGKPSNIAKHNGKVVSFYGDSMDLRESYTCDTCDTKFTVRASVLFNTSVEEDFEQGYTANFEKSQFIMDEYDTN